MHTDSHNSKQTNGKNGIKLDELGILKPHTHTHINCSMGMATMSPCEISLALCTKANMTHTTKPRNNDISEISYVFRLFIRIYSGISFLYFARLMHVPYLFKDATQWHRKVNSF